MKKYCLDFQSRLLLKLINAVGNYPHALELVPESYKAQIMCDKAAATYPSTKKLFLNDIRLSKCVIKQSIDVFLNFVILLIDIKLKRVVSEDPVLIVYSFDKYINQKMYD